MTDIIDTLAGIPPGGALDQARRARLQSRENAQLSYDLLLHPQEAGDLPLETRRAVALFVAALHGDAGIQAHYRALLVEVAPDLVPVIEGLSVQGKGVGPFGHYPAGPLSAENSEGVSFTATGVAPPLAAALNHAHFLTLHPRDASPEKLQTLLDAGWTTPAIVTLSQLVAFLAFQLRVIGGLRLAQSVSPAAQPATTH
ncbi:CMD domain protein [Ketogulonicigenium vulgare]|uniref:CMD domain protein n=1 Tax=Ketogulonicigenium vulgare TaxID=92945 RepID=UPI002358C829|nr:CMD domain protein [Ketogulonicigenium vulgare]